MGLRDRHAGRLRRRDRGADRGGGGTQAVERRAQGAERGDAE